MPGPPQADGGFDLGGIAHGALDFAGFIPIVGAVPDLLNASLYLAEGDLAMASLSAVAAVPLVGDAVGAGKIALKYGDDVVRLAAHQGDDIAQLAVRQGDDVAAAAGGSADGLIGKACSFSATTRVATPTGSTPIAELDVGDEVIAQDPATGETGTYPITAVWSHPDSVTGTVTIDGESIDTTPTHPFLSVERGWTAAGDLHAGDEVEGLDGRSGTVVAVTWNGGPAEMWNLTVGTVHTFSVGPGRWVVHNDCGDTFDALAGEFADDANVGFSHPVNDIQLYGGPEVGHGGVTNLTNADLVRHGGPTGGDPIAGYRSFRPGDLPGPGSQINLLAGNHRAFVIGQRVRDGLLDPAMVIRITRRFP